MTHAKTRQNSHPLNSGNILMAVTQSYKSTIDSPYCSGGGRGSVHCTVDGRLHPEASMWVKSLRQATVASSIQLEEVDFYGNVMAPLDTAKKDKGKRRDWLTLLDYRESSVWLERSVRMTNYMSVESVANHVAFLCLSLQYPKDHHVP